jgi:indolepyruvate ferredoxin oxidoreductase
MLAGRLTSLDAIYNDDQGPAFMSGIQALVRLPLMQRRLDRQHGLNTAGLVTGYRGSPLGAYDQQLWKAAKHLEAHDVVFQAGLNEDLAATALWGAQMHKAFGETKADGVFGVWYGKGPGVDRTGDAFRTANMLGTSPLGGVLAVAGDDHSAHSSMYPHQTDGIFHSVQMPVLQPSSVAEILSLGLAGLELSRFSGLWVAMKTVAEVVESAASFVLPATDPKFVTPAGLAPQAMRSWDPSIAWPAQRAEFERRMLDYRLPAARDWAAANRLDRPVLGSTHPRICFVTVGKAHQDLMQALTNLGISDGDAADLGIAVYKVAMSWPLDTDSLIRFAGACETIIVVEEKLPIVEDQLKVALYGLPGGHRPKVQGKDILPAALELSPLIVARAVAKALVGTPAAERVTHRLGALEARADGGKVVPFPTRKPFFCSGCPHNSSTKTPEGSISGGGIGCHIMALSQPALKTTTFSHMGGEGAQWMGAAPFSETRHIFQNIGDGTYQHSGLLAIRAAVAAKTAITYKILYNDAVAMTGGQPHEGQLSPAAISRQLVAEGVGDVRLVSDEPDLWRDSDLAPGVRVHHRDELDAVQRELRDVPGVTAIIYVQTCAAEKRRRRKRKALADPPKRLFINHRVCEGCGDCSVQSNCIAVEPRETEFGRKRQINQSNCNKDFSCVKGFCPSFVEIDGPVLRRPDADRLTAYEAERFMALPDPAILARDGVCNVYIAGIGGLRVLTLGALLGTAAYLEGKEATVLDFTGLAQKNGAVVSQVRIAPTSDPIHAVRIGEGDVDVMLATDAVVASAADGLLKLAERRTALVLNSDETPTSDFVTDRDAKLPSARMIETLLQRAGQGFTLRATAIAQGVFGDAVAANVMVLGYAWQQGLLPLSLAALHGAIEANGAAVEMNKRALAWGRLAAIDLAEVERMAGLATPVAVDEALEVLVNRRALDLTRYQYPAYAEVYTSLVTRAAAACQPFGEEFSRAVAENAFKVMAYKDEYEVARLYADPAFRADLERQFAGVGKVSVWLAPPLLSRVDPSTGRPAKRKFGPWIFKAFAVLARLKGLRGRALDPFGRTAERRAERALRDQYLTTIAELCEILSPATVELATEIAKLPEDIRGFGPVKEAAMAQGEERRMTLLARLQAAQAVGSPALAA